MMNTAIHTKLRLRLLPALVAVVFTLFGCNDRGSNEPIPEPPQEQYIGGLFTFTHYFSQYIKPDSISLSRYSDQNSDHIWSVKWHSTQGLINQPSESDPVDEYLREYYEYKEQAAAHYDAEEKRLLYGLPVGTTVILDLRKLKVLDTETKQEVSSHFILRYHFAKSLVLKETKYPNMLKVEKRLDQLTGEDLFWLGYDYADQKTELVLSDEGIDPGKFSLVAEFEGRDPIIVPLTGAAGDK